MRSRAGAVKKRAARLTVGYENGPWTGNRDDLRSHKFGKQPDYNPCFDNVKGVLDVVVDPIWVVA